ncbi:MAG: nucleotidyltransferase family protein [Actinomycetota bacterium]
MPATGILLAAGLGERLRPLTHTLPKPALPLLDVPLGAWGLCNLLEATDRVVVNASYLSEVTFGALAGYGEFETLDEGLEPWGTGGTLAALRDRIPETALVFNGDALVEVSAAELLDAHHRSGAAATVAVGPVGAGADLLVSGGRATGFIDRRARPDLAGARYLGVGAFEAAVLDSIPESRPAGLAESLLRPLAERGDVKVYETRSYARDVGTVAGYLQASLDLLEGRGPPTPRPPPGELVDVEGGRAYLGLDVGADEESIGPGAMVLAGAALHEGSYVSNAIVWPDEEVPAGTRVAGGVWARGELLPARSARSDPETT